jgi:hypothetical protein
VPLPKAQFDCALGNAPEAIMSLSPSSGVINLDSISTNRIHLTGPGNQVYWYGPVDTSVTPGGTVTKRVNLDGGITIVHYPPYMTLLKGANRLTADGDVQVITGDGNGYWQEEEYNNIGSGSGGSVVDMQGEISALQSRCTALENRCTTIENNISTLFNWMNTVVDTGLATSGYVSATTNVHAGGQVTALYGTGNDVGLSTHVHLITSSSTDTVLPPKQPS